MLKLFVRSLAGLLFLLLMLALALFWSAGTFSYWQAWLYLAVFGSWVGMAFTLPVLLVIVARLRSEETFLSANLPGYEDYRRKVRHRLIPFVW
jgi:protein-S-isoprenylcysteine O-methyltransferase Ste14